MTCLGGVVSAAQDGLKDRKAAREKEVNKQGVYDKVRRNFPNNTQKQSRALDDMQRARQEAAQVSRKAEEHMTNYELQKLRDTKVSEWCCSYSARSIAHVFVLHVQAVAPSQAVHAGNCFA